MIGCTSPPIDRQSRLLTLAAGEAQQIEDSGQRLARQLNFANLQSARGQKDEARQSLVYATRTLRDAKAGDLKSQIRIAGWVSISELYRGIDDHAGAQSACDQAVMVLRTLDPVSDRPDYVIGVAGEVQALQGKQPAAKLLEESADWVKQMHGQSLQRVALAAICDAIFNDDDYAGGLAVLRADDDAAWRSDTLAMLAQEDTRTFDGPSNVANASLPGSYVSLRFKPTNMNRASDDAAPGAPPAKSFGKPVDFQSVFGGRTGVTEEDAATQPMPPLDQH